MPPLFDLAPPWVWTLLCLGLATFYVLKWPRERVGAERRGWRYWVLRWFHALVWLVLAAAVWLHAADAAAPKLWARGLALGALAVYLVFALTLLLPRRSGT